MNLLDRFKSWFVATWLKRPPERLPRPSRDQGPDFDPPRFIDRFAERNSDREFQGIDMKVRQAISNARDGLGMDRD